MNAPPCTPPARRGKPLVLVYLPSIVLITLVLVGAALAVTRSGPARYQASSQVAVEPVVITNGPNPQPPDMGTEREIASSGAVRALAASALKVDPEDLKADLSVTVPVATHVLRIAYTSTSPATARVRSNALTRAYLSYRNAQAPLPGNTGPESTLAHAYLLTAATTPTSPARTSPIIIAIAATVVGLGLGVAVAALRDRVTTRLWDAAGVERALGAPVLSSVAAARSGRALDPAALTSELCMPTLDGGYVALAAKLARACEASASRHIAVTSAGHGEGASTTAAGLAMALAATRRVVLVSHAVPTGGHGLAGDGWLVTTGVPGLRVLREGASTVRMPALLQQADLVVIDAGAVLEDPASLGAIAQAGQVVVVVPARHGSARRLADTAREISQVGRPVHGAVLNGVRRRGATQPRPALTPAPETLAPVGSEVLT